MKTLLKWFVKSVVSRSTIKNAVHAANAALAKRTASDRGKTVIGAVNDVSEVGAAYLKAFADGEMDAQELQAANAAVDAALDKYLTDDVVNAVIDRLFA